MKHAILGKPSQAVGSAPANIPGSQVAIEMEPDFFPAHITVEKGRPKKIHIKIPPELASMWNYSHTQTIICRSAVKLDALPWTVYNACTDFDITHASFGTGLFCPLKEEACSCILFYLFIPEGQTTLQPCQNKLESVFTQATLPFSK